MRSSALSSACLFSVVVLMSACGAGGPLPVKAPTVASAIADKAPLVVDWPAGQRTDLEVTAHDGVAVVAVEPTTIRLLRDCHLSGSYGFLGVSTKEQVIRLDDAGDVALSLPLRGLGLAADLSGELGTSTALDVALVTIGRRRTIRTSAARSALTGSECKGATHYIRGYDVGAFVLATSEKSSASTVAGLFGAKGSYARKSAKAVRETDGNLDACKSVQPGDSSPPAQCSAALRLDLKALDEDESVDDGTCGPGLVRAAGKCTPKAKVAPKVAFECNPAHEDECREECDAGNAASCGYLAQTMRHSSTKAPDFKAINAVAERGCTGGSERACVVLGELLQYGNGVAVDIKRAAELYEKACTSGEPVGCFREGAVYDRRPGLPVDYKKATELYDRACRGGFADGCNNLGALAVAGHGTAVDPAKARTIYESACKNGSAVACGNLGDLMAAGLGGAKDAARAADLWSQACASSGTHCVRLGDATSGAGPLPKDALRSVDSYQRGMKILSANCTIGVADRCDELGWLFHDGRAVPRDDGQALSYIRKGCDLGSPEACNHVGMFLEQGWGVAQNKLEAENKYKQACDAGNLRACVSFALLGPEAKGRQALIERACEGGLAEGCFHQARIERLESMSSTSSAAGKRMEKACTDGYAPACAYLGRWSLRSGSSERPAALRYLESACEKGDLGGCGSLAEVLIESGSGVERAEGLARRACDGGIAHACAALGGFAARGKTKQVGMSEGPAFLQKACDGRELTACVTLAKGVVGSDPGRAASLLQRACDASVFSAADFAKALEARGLVQDGPIDIGPVGKRTIALGDLSGTGSGLAELGSSGSGPVGPGGSGRNGGTAGGLASLGGSSASFDDGIDRGRSGTGKYLLSPIRRDELAAKRLIDRADAGEPTGDDQQAGCGALGEMHEKGLGFPADPHGAERFYAMSCAHGDGGGCTRLGGLEERAKTKDKARLLALYDRACSLYDVEGCLKSAALAAASTNKDQRNEATDSFELACDLGSAEGCLRAGTVNENDRHFVHALDLFDKGCAKKDKKTCDAATRLRPRVDAAEKAADQAREKFRAAHPDDRVRGPAGDVRVGALSASVPVADAERVVAGMRVRARACYQRGLNADPGLSGKMTISAKIDAMGAVNAADAVTNTGLSPDVTSCVTTAVKRASFAAPGGSGSTLLIPFVFVPKN